MKNTTKKSIGYTDKSVRDNSQRAVFKNGIITVINRFGRRKVFEYSFSIDEWDNVGKLYGNPDYRRYEFIRQKFMEFYKGNYLDEACFVDRLIDSQFYAVKKVLDEVNKMRT